MSENQELEKQTLDEETNGLCRRDFLKILLGVTALAWGAMTTYPIFRYLGSAAKEDSDVQVTSVALGKEDSVPKGSGKNFKFGSQPALLIRDDAGKFTAFSAVCTHLGCTVQYSGEAKRIVCGCHGGQYDPNTGTNIAGPPPKPLKVLNVEVVNDQIVVKKA